MTQTPDLKVGNFVKHFRGQTGMVIRDPYLAGGNWWIRIRWDDRRKSASDVMVKTLSKPGEARKGE